MQISDTAVCFPDCVRGSRAQAASLNPTVGPALQGRVFAIHHTVATFHWNASTLSWPRGWFCGTGKVEENPVTLMSLRLLFITHYLAAKYLFFKPYSLVDFYLVYWLPTTDFKGNIHHEQLAYYFVILTAIKICCVMKLIWLTYWSFSPTLVNRFLGVGGG